MPYIVEISYSQQQNNITAIIGKYLLFFQSLICLFFTCDFPPMISLFSQWGHLHFFALGGTTSIDATVPCVPEKVGLENY